MRVIGTTWQFKGSLLEKKDLLELDGGEPCLEFTYGKSFYNWNILELSRASFSNSQELLVTIN